MIIGGSKKEVINNIKTNIENNELNKKVEIKDPNLSEEEINNYINKFYRNKKSSIYFIKNKIANKTVKKIAKEIYPNIDIIGFDNHGIIIFKAVNVEKNKVIVIKQQLKNTNILEMPAFKSKKLKMYDKLTFIRK